MKNSIKKNALTLAITVAAAGAIFAVTSYNVSQMAHAAQAEKMSNKSMVELDNQPLPQVAVQTTQAGTYQAKVIGYGETKPRYELDLASEVSGQVDWVADSFEAGRTVSKGAILAKIDDVSYQQALAQALSEVATAKLELLEEQRQGEQARSEWKRSGLTGEPSSPLVLREPQLASAKAKLNNAQKALDKAKSDLENTQIRAPFDGVIVSRTVQPGSYLASGAAVATVYSIDRIEIEIPLSEKQWRNLPDQASQLEWSATISDSAGVNQWQAKVERQFQYVTQQTRQRSIVLTVDSPLTQEQPLYPGTFVQATIMGANVENLWQLPASALSQQGDIWSVDGNGLLVKKPANAVFENNTYVYVTPTTQSERADIVLRPLSNFKVGMKVEPLSSDSSQVLIAANKSVTEGE